MGNKSYIKGRNFEYRVKKYYENKGYYVIRSAGSHGIFDLIAISNTKVLGIQCRVNKKIKKDEIEKMAEFETKYGITPVIAYRNGKKLIIEPISFPQNNP